MKELFKKYVRNECSPEEVNLLLKQFEIEENKELLSSLITQQLDAEQDLTSVNEKVQEDLLEKTYSNIRSQIFLKINLILLQSASAACVGFLMTVLFLFSITQSIEWLLNVCCKASSGSIAEL